MKIWLLPNTDDSKRLACTHPESGAQFVIVADVACHLCGFLPFTVAGGDPYPSNDDRAYEARAECLACKATVGTLRAEVSTIFGVTEDMAVMDHGRCRVY